MATAVQVEALWNGLTDNSGSTLSAGKVYTYYAGTSTPVSLFTSHDKSTSATNPLILDGYGRAKVWADGRYKFVVKTSADVTLYTLDNLIYGFDDSQLIWGGLSTGSANVVTITAIQSLTQYAVGQKVSYIAANTNTGPTTANINNIGAVSIVKAAGGVPLEAGDIVAGQGVNLTFEATDGGRFRLDDYPTVADIQQSRFTVAEGISGINTILGTLTPAPVAYEAGMVIRFKANSANTGACTLNLNTLGAKAVQWQGSALVGGEILANTWVEVVYDGTQFQLVNPSVAVDIYGRDVAGSNTITATGSPNPGAYSAGMKVWFKAAAENTGPVTFNLNSLGAKDVQIRGAALVKGEIEQNAWIELVYDGTAFQVYSRSTSSGSNRTQTALVSQVQDGSVLYVGSVAGTDTITGTLSPAITAYVEGQKFVFKAAGANTGAVTIQLNGITGAKALKRMGSALTGGEIQAGDIVEIVYDGTDFQWINAISLPLYINRTSGLVDVASTGAQSAISNYSASANGGSHLLRKSRGATVGTNTAVVSGDTLGNILFQGNNGSGFLSAAGIAAYVDGALGTNIPGGMIFYTGSSSAGITEKARLTTAGRLGVGVTNPPAPLSVSGTIASTPAVNGVHVGTNGTNSVIELVHTTGGYIDFSDTVTDHKGRIAYDNATNVMSFKTNAGERMRIMDDGELRIATTAASPFGVQVNIDGSAKTGGVFVKQDLNTAYCLMLQNSATSGTRNLIAFYKDGATPTRVGVISHDGTNTTYSTSSDYRLKEQVQPMKDRLELVKKLKPSTFVWKDGQIPGQGFIAHELQQFVPEAVSGEKDAVDADGNPVYQGVDLSFLVATLTAAVQELAAKVEALEAK